MAKREQSSIAASIEGGTLTLKFADGRTVVMDSADLSMPIRHAAMMHGLKQKLCDASAMSRDPETGRSATLDDKYKAVLAVRERLLAGEWSAKRGDGTGNGGLLFKALCRAYPNKSTDEIRAYHDGLSKAQQAALRTNPKLSPIIEAIKAEMEKDADGIDSDALLAGLEE